MKILVLSNEYPATSSLPGPQRLFHLARELSQQHSLQLLTFDECLVRKNAFTADPSTAGVFNSIISLGNRPDHSVSLPKRLRHFLSQEPYLSKRIKYPDFVCRIRNQIQQAIEEFDPDIIYINGLEMCQYQNLAEENRRPIVVDLCDCLSSLLRRQAVVTQGVKRISLNFEAKSIARWEKQVLEEADLVSVISQKDKSDLELLTAHSNLIVVGAGIDVDYFTPDAVAPPGETLRTIFSGVMSYPPNEDAAFFLTQEVLPAVRKEVPNSECLLLGAAPSQSLTGAARKQDVLVSGEVEDIRSWIRANDIFLCPLRFGAGVKGKILSAMSMRIPVVCTAISASGIDAESEKHLLIAETKEQLAAAALRLHREPELRRTLVDNAEQLVREHYAWANKSKPLEEQLEKLVSKS